MDKWNKFPHDNTNFSYPGSKLESAWEGLHRGDYGPMPEVIRLAGDFSTDRVADVGEPYWQAGTTESPVDPSLSWLVEQGLSPAFAPTDLPYLELELALSLGLHEYRSKTGIPGFTLALSGGRDSSMVALLVARGCRYANEERRLS